MTEPMRLIDFPIEVVRAVADVPNPDPIQGFLAHRVDGANALLSALSDAGFTIDPAIRDRPGVGVQDQLEVGTNRRWRNDDWCKERLVTLMLARGEG